MVERGNYSNLVGYYSIANAAYESPVHIPPGWDATMALEHEIVDKYIKKFDSLEKVIYGEGGYISPHFRG